MTKWLITYSRRKGARWNLVEFGGKSKSEARGIVDLIAIRKDHCHEGSLLKRGDLFDIILIQTKGGSAPKPKPEDIARLKAVAKHHRASDHDRGRALGVRWAARVMPAQLMELMRYPRRSVLCWKTRLAIEVGPV